MIHLNSENGLIVAMTFPRTKASGTGPKYLESREATRLSPTIQQWPFGTCASSQSELHYSIYIRERRDQGSQT